MFLLTIIGLFTLLILFYIIYHVLFQKFSHKFKLLEKIPGTKGYPVIGDLLDIFAPPEELFADDRAKALKYYPIYKFSVMNDAVVNVYKPEDVEVILSNIKFSKKSLLYDLLHPWLGTGLLTSEGTKWHNRRKILTPAFHFSILQNFINIFNNETQKLVQTIETRCKDEPSIDVIPVVTDFTLRSIIETSMGKKFDLSDSSRKYKRAVYDFGKVFLHRIARPWLIYPVTFYFSQTKRLLEKIVKTLHDFSEKVIEDKKNNFENSYSTNKRLAMLDLLLKAQSDGADINDEGIREEVDTFIFEGHDTTSVALCFILLTLANHEEYQDEIYQEIIDVLGPEDKEPTYQDLQNLSFMERCLKECLRLYPSVPFISRHTLEDIPVPSGYIIPAGAMINIHIYDIHHSPYLYTDPEKFDPDRFLPENTKARHPFAYIPFSAGPRNCIGQRYALLELKTAICGILRKFKLKPVHKRSDIVFITDLVLRTNNEIKVKFVPRNN